MKQSIDERTTTKSLTNNRKSSVDISWFEEEIQFLPFAFQVIASLDNDLGPATHPCHPVGQRIVRIMTTNVSTINK